MELQSPETMKLFGSTKKLIDNTINGKNIASFWVVEVVLVKFNLADNQYYQKSDILETSLRKAQQILYLSAKCLTK